MNKYFVETDSFNHSKTNGLKSQPCISIVYIIRIMQNIINTKEKTDDS